jgi:hypothetical protein
VSTALNGFLNAARSCTYQGGGRSRATSFDPTFAALGGFRPAEALA